jgi:hypothetical protein
MDWRVRYARIVIFGNISKIIILEIEVITRTGQSVTVIIAEIVLTKKQEKNMNQLLKSLKLPKLRKRKLDQSIP